MKSQPNDPWRAGYVDRPLPDGAVERTYTHGVVERRSRRSPNQIDWSNNRGESGVDVKLGADLVERRWNMGSVSEGQYLGNGVTSWSGGESVTVNETPLPEQAPLSPPRPSIIAGLLAALGLGGLFGLAASSIGPFGVPADPDLYPLYAERAQLRQQLLLGGGDDLHRAYEGAAGQARGRRHDIDSFG